MGYAEVHGRSLSEAEAFWAEAAEDIHWYKKWDKVLDDSNPPFYRWFTGGEVNTCYNTVDRHVEEGRGDQLALIYDTPITGEPTQKITFRELQHKVAHFAGALKAQGGGEGRPRHHLHADGARSRHRHAGLRAHWRGALGRFRRLRA